MTGEDNTFPKAVRCMPKRIQLFLCPHAEKKKETNFYDEAESMDCIDGTVPAVVRL